MTKFDQFIDCVSKVLDCSGLGDDHAGGVGDEVQVLSDPGEASRVFGLAASGGTEGDNSVLVVGSLAVVQDQWATGITLRMNGMGLGPAKVNEKIERLLTELTF